MPKGLRTTTITDKTHWVRSVKIDSMAIHWLPGKL